MDLTASRLTLGTASLGMAYGIANPTVAPDGATAMAILDQAWAAGIHCLDTAPAYGAAEERIGAWMHDRGVLPDLVTKLPPVSQASDADVERAVREHLAASLRALGVSGVAGYLTHGADDYLREPVRACLSTLVQEGKIGGYGPSVYTSDQVFSALSVGAPDLIQVPISAFDQRMVRSGALAACHKAGVKVFARSVFLQGALLMEPSQLSGGLARLAPFVERFRALAEDRGTSAQSLALRFVRDLPEVTSTIVGVYDAGQLRELVEAAGEPPLDAETAGALAAIAQEIPEAQLDPRRWA